MLGVSLLPPLQGRFSYQTRLAPAQYLALNVPMKKAPKVYTGQLNRIYRDEGLYRYTPDNSMKHFFQE